MGFNKMQFGSQESHVDRAKSSKSQPRDASDKSSKDRDRFAHDKDVDVKERSDDLAIIRSMTNRNNTVNRPKMSGMITQETSAISRGVTQPKEKLDLLSVPSKPESSSEILSDMHVLTSLKYSRLNSKQFMRQGSGIPERLSENSEDNDSTTKAAT